MRKDLVTNVQFTPVDPNYRKVEFFGGLLFTAPILIALVFLSILYGSWTFPGVLLWVASLVWLILSLWWMWLDQRRARIIGYAELEDELLVRTGILFQKVSVVPYGRMQKIDLKAGPLLRKWNLATIELVTAAASTDAEIPGLPQAEADRLRVKLTELAQARLEGL